ncbi:MAG TPA: hypothetical protein VF980_12800 [Thermoanaerobaculia bacterium]
MKVTIEDRGPALADRLRERLQYASRLRCDEHDQPVVAVKIVGRENGWFDSTWITCCEGLTRQASAIVKERC